MKRKEIKNAHEKSVLSSFKEFKEKNGDTLNIISQPDPPDAIIEINGKKSWIEISDAFLSPELAKSITSYASDDKTHIPVPKDKRLVIDPDRQFSSILRKVIINKYTKSSIGKVFSEYGGGILLVGIINPFAYAKDLVVTEKEQILEKINLEEKRFHEIYFYEVNNHEFVKFL